MTRNSASIHRSRFRAFDGGRFHIEPIDGFSHKLLMLMSRASDLEGAMKAAHTPRLVEACINIAREFTTQGAASSLSCHFRQDGMKAGKSSAH
jgi:hypothetical protein